jgi:transaldolase
MALRLLLDSAAAPAWQAWLPSGLFRGVTTNPTLLRRAGVPCDHASLADLCRLARDLGCQELHLQAWGAEAGSLVDCGQRLAALDPALVRVKLPIDRAGADAGRQLVAAGVPVTFTAAYEASQVLIAAALGATDLAPYLGRIQDQGRDGLAELTAMQRCLDGLGCSLQLLVASLRQPQDLVALAAVGVDSFTLSPLLADRLFACAATEEAAAVFLADALAEAPAEATAAPAP